MKKAKVKALKQLAEILPVSYEIQKQYQVVDVWALEKHELETIKFDYKIDDKVKRPNLVIVPINHKNRLQNAYAKGKENAIQDYILWVDRNNAKLNELAKNINLPQVDQRLLDISKTKSGFWSLLIQFLFGFYHIFIKKSKAA